MAYATIDDLLDIDATIQDYGILQWDEELQKSEDDIKRLLRIRWWPVYLKSVGPDIRRITGNIEMDPTRLTDSQWRRSTVFHCLAYYILPKLSKFEPNEDVFQVKMLYYKQRFEEEFDLSVRDGVEYDADDNNVITADEKTPETFLRLRR